MRCLNCKHDESRHTAASDRREPICIDWRTRGGFAADWCRCTKFVPEDPQGIGTLWSPYP